MKKIIFNLCCAFICCLFVNVCVNDSACSYQVSSNDKHFCSCNKDEINECDDSLVSLLIIDRNDEGD